jgi:bifunctional non-homologous end joining protein LigD
MHWHNPGPVRRPPGFIEPCLPTISRTVPTGRQWAYEIKHDGFRFLAVRQGERVRIYSRNGHDWSKQLPAITDALQALPVRSAMLDGEGVLRPRRQVRFRSHARLLQPSRRA